MKKLFLGNNGKNLVGRAIILSIIGLITVTAFMSVKPSSVFGAPRTSRSVTLNLDDGSVGPRLNHDADACTVFTDTLSSPPSPYTLSVGNAPSCDQVDWIFPSGVTDGKNCTFTLDGNFDDGLTIDFYNFRDREPTSDDNPIATTTVDNSSSDSLSVSGDDIQQAHLETSTDEAIAQLADNDNNSLGDISYNCSSGN